MKESIIIIKLLDGKKIKIELGFSENMEWKEKVDDCVKITKFMREILFKKGDK